MTSKEIKAAQDALDHVRVPTGPDGVLSEAGATLQLTQATLEVALQIALFNERESDPPITSAEQLIDELRKH